MKKIITLLSLLAVLGVTGCASTGSTPSPGTQLALTQAAVTGAAAAGTAYELSQDPTTLPYFQAGEQTLTSLATGTNALSLDALKAALNTAGQSNVVITVAIDNALNLANIYINSTGSNAVPVQAVAGWLATGIQQGIALKP